MLSEKQIQEEINSFNPELLEVDNRVTYNLRSYSTCKFVTFTRFEVYLGNDIVQIEHIPTGITFVIHSPILFNVVRKEKGDLNIIETIFQNMFSFLTKHRFNKFLELIETSFIRTSERGRSKGESDLQAKLQELLGL